MSEVEETADMEKRVEALMAELAEARAKSERLEKEREAMEKEQEMIKRLSAEGVKDLEAAVAIAKARISKDEKLELGTIIEQMKKEKQYLFPEKAAGSVTTRTSPAKEQRSGTGVLEKSARKAAQTGSRADLQEYMRKRRSVV